MTSKEYSQIGLPGKTSKGRHEVMRMVRPPISSKWVDLVDHTSQPCMEGARAHLRVLRWQQEVSQETRRGRKEGRNARSVGGALEEEEEEEQQSDTSAYLRRVTRQ